MSADLHQFLLQALGVPSLHVAARHPLEHQRNRLYEARRAASHFIVKEYLMSERAEGAALREFQALQWLAPLDLAPQPVLHAPEHGLPGIGPLLVYKYMEGEMWDRQPRTSADLAALAEGWRLMNSLPLDGLWPSYGGTLDTLRTYVERFAHTFDDYRTWAVLEYPAGCAVADQSLRLLERGVVAAAKLQASPTVRCFCRADPRFANVIARPDGRIGFVDWEDCGLRDPACDVADLLVHANQEDLVSPEMWQVFLDRYVPTRTAVDAGFGARLQSWRLLFPLRWLERQMAVGLERVRAGRLAGWTINGQPPNWRLRRYLARGLAWPHTAFEAELAAIEALSFFPGVD